MTNNAIKTPGTVGAGDIQFFDSIQPPLKTDTYTIDAHQKVENVVDDKNKTPSYQSKKSLNIVGPRFQINPSTIHSIFPPANQRGNYANFLPNIVFNDFSLPWSRAIDPTNTSQNEDVPWIGLLTLHQEDIEGDNPPVSAPRTITTAELVNSGKKVLPPDLGAGFVGDDTQVRVVDISLNFFQSIAPELDELKFLSHARAVNTDGKVVLNMDADGCFSLCIGNRLPAVGQKNQILLVSYEGHQKHLHGDDIQGDYNTIRLVQLGGWEFTTTNFDNEFINMMEALCHQGNGGVSLVQMETESQTQQNEMAKEALEIGYIGLQNKMRAGEHATSWYRGPLMPAPTKRESLLATDEGNYGPYIYSDHAIHYDSETGIFNHAYSSAWQIGRLLALSNAAFAQGIFNWRADYLQSIVDLARQKQVSSAAKSIQKAIGNQEPPAIHTAARAFFSDTFNNVSWDTMQTRKQKMLGKGLPGVMTDQQVEKIYQDDEDPLLSLNKKIK